MGGMFSVYTMCLQYIEYLECIVYIEHIGYIEAYPFFSTRTREKSLWGPETVNVPTPFLTKMEMVLSCIRNIQFRWKHDMLLRAVEHCIFSNRVDFFFIISAEDVIRFFFPGSLLPLRFTSIRILHKRINIPKKHISMLHFVACLSFVKEWRQC